MTRLATQARAASAIRLAPIQRGVKPTASNTAIALRLCRTACTSTLEIESDANSTMSTTRTPPAAWICPILLLRPCTDCSTN